MLARYRRWVEIEWLPSYAPELNPTEQVWTRSKYADLANFLPEGTQELKRSVRCSLRHTSQQQHLLRSFLAHAKLKL